MWEKVCKRRGGSAGNADAGGEECGLMWRGFCSMQPHRLSAVMRRGNIPLIEILGNTEAGDLSSHLSRPCFDTSYTAWTKGGGESKVVIFSVSEILHSGMTAWRLARAIGVVLCVAVCLIRELLLLENVPCG